jgi:hypothetical protein
MVFSERHSLKSSQAYFEIARWLKSEELPTMRFDTIASFPPSWSFGPCLTLQTWCAIASWRV